MLLKTAARIIVHEKEKFAGAVFGVTIAPGQSVTARLQLNGSFPSDHAVQAPVRRG